MSVEERFSNGQTAIAVFNVGDLIEELQKLPAETPVRCDFSEGADLVLFNANTVMAHVVLCHWESDENARFRTAIDSQEERTIEAADSVGSVCPS